MMLTVSHQKVTMKREKVRAWYRRHGPIKESFPEQVAAARSDHPFEGWQCDRRAGKTTTVALRFHEDGYRYPNAEYVYIAKTRSSAKDIAWGLLKEFKRRYDLYWTFHEGDLRITHETGAWMKLYGADNPAWIDRLHGRKLRAAFLDEAAQWAIDMRPLVFDVLEPTTTDLEGVIRLMSRPGVVKAGLFWDLTQGKYPDWVMRKWSWRDNPYVRDAVRKRIDARKAVDPDLESRADFRRNYRNEWASDDGELVYGSFDRERCGVAEWKVEPGDFVCLGVDLGWHDKTAFSLVTWSRRHPYIVELESYAQSQMLLDHVAARCKMYLEEYPGLVCTCDPGRKQAFEQLRQRHGVPFVPARKEDKRHWIDLINGQYEQGKVKIVRAADSPHVDEMAGLVWEMRGHTTREAPAKENDCCDAFLYAFREAHAYAYTEGKPQPTTDEEVAAAEAEALERYAEEEYEAQESY